MPLKTLELFGGTCRLSRALSERGCIVTLHERFGDRVEWGETMRQATTKLYEHDILEIDKSKLPVFDFIHASPECRTYSKMAQSEHKRGPSNQYRGVTEEAEKANRVLDKLVAILLDQLKRNPKLRFIIENPWNACGGMHLQPIAKSVIEKEGEGGLGAVLRIVSYCMFGEEYEKETMLWTNIPRLAAELQDDAYRCGQGGHGCDHWLRFGKHRKTVRDLPAHKGAEKGAAFPRRVAAFLADFVVNEEGPAAAACSSSAACCAPLQPRANGASASACPSRPRRAAAAAAVSNLAEVKARDAEAAQAIHERERDVFARSVAQEPWSPEYKEADLARQQRALNEPDLPDGFLGEPDPPYLGPGSTRKPMPSDDAEPMEVEEAGGAESEAAEAAQGDEVGKVADEEMEAEGEPLGPFEDEAGEGEGEGEVEAAQTDGAEAADSEADSEAGAGTEAGEETDVSAEVSAPAPAPAPSASGKASIEAEAAAEAAKSELDAARAEEGRAERARSLAEAKASRKAEALVEATRAERAAAAKAEAARSKAAKAEEALVAAKQKRDAASAEAEAAKAELAAAADDSSRCAATVRSMAAREACIKRAHELLRQADTLYSPSAGATGEMPGAAPPLPMDFVEGLD